MPIEPGKTPVAKTPPPKPKNDGFVVFEVDGFAQLTPEQRTWPVVTTNRSLPPTEPPTELGESPPKT